MGTNAFRNKETQRVLRKSGRLPQAKFSLTILWLPLVLSYLIVGCSDGGSSRIAVPSSLVYPLLSIKAVVGGAIQSDSPSVSGTVTSFTISPALPAGLSIDPVGGTISGTPTASAASATYTITAANSAGSTTAIVQIAVVGPPSNLVYPQTTITANVGVAIQPDTPTASQPIATVTASPALPLGLNLDQTSGTISGTPTQAVPQTQYTITATNGAGSTTAQVTISVTQGSKVLLELGHGAAVTALRTAGDRLLSEDGTGHWVLWNYTSGQIVTSGDGGSGQIDLAGQVAVIGTATSVQVLSAIDGSVTASIPTAAWWQLATDGSYLCTGSATALTIWSTTGAQQATRSGDYHAAVAFVGPTQVQVALGSAGASVIETISVPSGNSSVSPQFSGSFKSWFTDGQRFLTTNSNQVRTYSNAGIQQAAVTLPNVYGITGQGNWIWVPPANFEQPWLIYAIGATTPTSSFILPIGAAIYTSGLLAASLNLPHSSSSLGAVATEIDIVDLSGTTPILTKYGAPPDANLCNYDSLFAASSATQWVATYCDGEIFDGASPSSAPRYFGYGVPQSIATSPSLVALSTPTGKILLLDPTGANAPASIDLWADFLAISSDGTVLGATTATSSGEEINVYSLPSQKQISAFPAYNAFFTMSASGNAIGIINGSTSTGIMNGPTSTRSVTDLSGKITWSDSGGYGPVYLSPDGTLVAAPNEVAGVSCSIPTTNVYKNGVLVTTLPADAEGWIDNDHLLTSNWAPLLHCIGNAAYTGSAIYNSTGAVIATIPNTAALYPSPNPQFPTADTVFLRDLTYSFNIPHYIYNALYSISNGALIWQPPSGASHCAVSGSNVVCQVGHQMLLYPY